MASDPEDKVEGGQGPTSCVYGMLQPDGITLVDCGELATHTCAGSPYCTLHSTGKYACGSERPLEVSRGK